jgi:DNA sulfur modification protein DndC
MGPLTLEARKYFFAEILLIQEEVNAKAIEVDMPKIDILNAEEIMRIRELIEAKTWPDKWSGDEVNAAIPPDETYYQDGSVMETLFKHVKD